jgi:hypothetical protein
MNADAVKTLMELSKAGIDSVNAFWSLYSGVAFGLLGYVFTAERAVQSVGVRVVLVFAFLFFAAGNYRSLSREQRKAIALSDYVDSELSKHRATQVLARTVYNNRPSEEWNVAILHAFLDAIIAGVIFWVPAIRSSGQTRSTSFRWPWQKNRFRDRFIGAFRARRI